MPNVHFFRPEQDVSPFLFALDAFVYLSESEGLGSAALLAMAHGLPVIASDAGGLPEIVRDGETGLLIDNSTEELRAALERLLARPEQAAALGRQGRALVERCASDDIMAEQTEQTYQKAVQGPTSKVQSRSGPGV
jgi:glycosyltransferase involved in cell wall biosynthesis